MSQNVAIIVLTGLLLILLYKIYYRAIKNPQVYSPDNLQDIQNIIVKGDTIVSGNTTPTTSDIRILSTNLDKISSIDIENKKVTVECGCKINDICIYLDQYGLALNTIPKHNKSIGSICSTAEHGSNLDSGTISDQIVDITIVLANGHIRKIEIDDPEFPAFATGLGRLGIIYSITLQCIDNYLIATTIKNGVWTDIKNDILSDLDKYRLSEIIINPITLYTKVMLRRKISSSSQLEKDEYIETLQIQPLGKETHEVAVPYQYTIQSIDDVLNLCKNTLCDIIITFTGADFNSWLSPASGRKSTWIQINTRTQSILQKCEDLLLYKYSGRPNWNTSSIIDNSKTFLVYGASLDYFRKIKSRFDPTNKFKSI